MPSVRRSETPASTRRSVPAADRTAAPADTRADLTAGASADDAAGGSVAEALTRVAARLADQARDDAEGALAALMRLEEKPRRHLGEDVVRTAALHAPQRTLAWLERHVPDQAERQRLLTAAYAGIAGRDPAFAMNALEALGDDEARRLARHQVLETWAADDVVAAYEWARGQQGEGADEALAAVMHTYVRQRPQQAGQLIAAMPAGQMRNRLAESYVDHVASSDPESALEWASALGDDAPLFALRASAFDQWAQREPWAAMENAALVDGEASFELVGRIAARAGLDRPAELAARLDEVAESHRARAAEALAGAWAGHDPQAARDWAGNLPDGPVRDAALGAMLRSGRSQATAGNADHPPPS